MSQVNSAYNSTKYLKLKKITLPGVFPPFIRLYFRCIRIIVSFIYASIFWQAYPRKLFKLEFDVKMYVCKCTIKSRIEFMVNYHKSLAIFRIGKRKENYFHTTTTRDFVRNLNCEFAFVISFCISNCDLNMKCKFKCISFLICLLFPLYF